MINLISFGLFYMQLGCVLNCVWEGPMPYDHLPICIVLRTLPEEVNYMNR